MAPRTFLVDGSALAYRSFFAKGPGPAYAYAAALFALIEKGRPDYALVALDTPEPTFRHRAFAAYKATREKTPDELVEQFPVFERIASCLGFPIYALPGWEADDVIGTLARRAEAAGHEVYLVTADKDFLQVVDEQVRIWNPGAGAEPVIQGVEAVRERFHCRPDQVIDVLGLMGDSSDNIPGVPQVGEKTALKLIEQYEGLDDLYRRLDGVKPPGLQARLREGRELAFLSRDLATIRTNAPVAVELPALQYRGPDADAARALFVELDFPSLAERLGHRERDDERRYHVVATRDEYEAFLARLRSARALVFDLETTALTALEAEIVGLAFAFEGHEAWYLPANLGAPIFGPGERGLTARERCGGADGAGGPDGASMFAERPAAGWRTTGRGLIDDPLRPPPGSDLARFLEDLRPALTDPGVAVIGQNVKYDLLVLGRYGISPPNVTFDTMLASYCLDAHQSQHGLDFLALKHLGITKIPTSALIGKGAKQINMWDVPVERCGEYACEDADTTFRLYELFSRQLEGHEVEKVFRDIELPLLRVLEDMERQGFLVDTALLAALSAEMAGRLEVLTAKIHELAGSAFNVASPKQLAEVLFEKLKVHEQLGVKRLKRTNTGYSTDAEVLETLAAHPLVAALLEHRQLTKLKGTYLDALPGLVHPVTGRIHTSFNQAVAATGRLSSTDPNLQNIPIRTEEGRRIRQAFIAAPGTTLLSADYSQVELRLMAQLSGDAALIEAFRSGEDVHRRTAALVFGVPQDAVTPDMRAQAKTINFGIIYGMGAPRLARQIGIPQKEAAAFIEQYFKVFSGVRAWLDKTREQALRDRFVTTLTGRRRQMVGLDSADPRELAGAMNAAVNTPLQGTAADLIKIAMVRLHRELLSRKLRARMLLQVHDELVLEVPEGELEVVQPLVKQVMETALQLDVPLVVQTGTGRNWLEAH
ncbi:MAG TPA: DNA polymerase I [Planctomycetota bacterium]|nr:DNA polymerase I [Planctomycetota bacterium]